MKTKIIGIFIVTLLIGTAVLPVAGIGNKKEGNYFSHMSDEEFNSDCPDDFELFIYCGGFDTWSPTYMLYVNATGEVFYYNVTYDCIFLCDFIPVSSFNFTNDEMDEIWDMIVSNDFFNLESHYERESVCDGSFINITITGNGITHSVQTENIDMYKLDNIVKLIIDFLPDNCDLFYTALINHAPLRPGKPSGLLTGKVRGEYNYTSIGFDADDDYIHFMFDWGDGTNSGWVGLYESSVNVSLKQSWNEKGVYNVRVKSIDDPNNVEVLTLF